MSRTNGPCGSTSACRRMCRGMGKAQHHRLAGRGRQPVLGRFAQDRRAERIRHDQPGVRWENLAWHVHDRGEEQPVAMQPVLHPFLVGAKIGHRGFYFDNDDFTVAAERDQIGAPAGRQRQFRNHAIAERMQIARRAAGNGQARSAIAARRPATRTRARRGSWPGFQAAAGSTADGTQAYARHALRLRTPLILPRRRDPGKPPPGRRAMPRSRRVR